MAILGLLKRQPMHGYDLRKRLRSDFGLLSSLSFGSLYPALARLEHDGAVRELTAAPEAPPAEVVAFTGSMAGERAAFRARLAARSSAVTRPTRTTATSRTRKVYELTPSGEELFERLLGDDGADSSDGKDGKAFALRWAFARHLAPEARLRLLERRRRQLEDRRVAIVRSADSPPRPLDRFERSLVEHSSATIAFELDWIDHLITAERAARPDGVGEQQEPAAEVS
ncbi:MAG: PadR family transcriptional regulator [Acidimicrobiales bacterium]|jgi:DNA-binding PadR family transcriptional regulator